MLERAISDQKRFVRGEHWIRARYHLRARDGVHHAPWRVLTVAGPAPHEEITCIRELMPRAHVTAVDVSAENVAAAKAVGASEAVACDLGNLEEVNLGYGNKKWVAPQPLRDLTFDVICLDLTGPSNDWLRRVFTACWDTLSMGGVMVVTFSYGRDVVEYHDAYWQKHVNRKRSSFSPDPAARLSNLPQILVPRVWFLLRAHSRHLDSCLQYRGNQMPMVSCLLVRKGGGAPASFAAVEPDDYALAVTAENVGNVYACPADRLLELRRKMAARRAVNTRQRRKLEALEGAAQ